MITKKKFVNLVENRLKEMAMDFDTADRPDTGLQGKLERGDTPLKKIPMPNTGREPNQNFQELLASERYRNVVQNMRRYTGYQGTFRGMNMGPLLGMMMDAHYRIVEIERAHRNELEELAVELVKKEMGIPEGAIQFDVKIIETGQFNTNDFNRENITQQQNQSPVDIEKDLFTQLETFNLEKAKRRLINNIIQGASKRGHYMYHYVEPELAQITGSDDLINLYGVMMSVNDGLYWQMGDESIAAAGASNSVAGKESVKRETNPPTVVVRAINFPVLIHELIKGVMELFAIQGRPENEESFDDIENDEDTLEKEMWDLRLGPAIWDRMKSQFPEELLEENNVELSNYLITAIFRLPTKNFLVLMKEVLSKSGRGRELLSDLLRGVQRMLNDEEIGEDIEDFQTTLDDITQVTDDEDVEEFLNTLDLNDEQSINRYLDSLNRKENPENN